MSQGLTFNHLRSLSRTSTKKSAGSKEIPVCLWTQSNWSSQILVYCFKKKIFVLCVGFLDVNNCVWNLRSPVCLECSSSQYETLKVWYLPFELREKKTIQSYREAESKSDEHRNPFLACVQPPAAVPASQGPTHGCLPCGERAQWASWVSLVLESKLIASLWFC